MRSVGGAGHDVVRTYEPGDTAAGRRIRDIVLSPKTGDLAPRAEALLYAADKAQHLAEVVRPALERGAVVVCDRYVDSMLAYQGAGRMLELSEVESITRWATDDVRADLTVVLDMDPALAVGEKRQQDRVEAAGDGFHARARSFFLDLAARDADRYLVLDARLSRAEITDRILERLQPMLATTPVEPTEPAGRECLGRLAQCLRDPDVQVIADMVDGSVSAGSAASVVSPVTEQGVWAELVGQEVAVETLRRAVSGEPHAMSHAWLFTGPPGSGRSNAGRAFAAALQCARGGCRICTDCRSALSGAHPDVTLVRTEQLSIGVEEVRELVRRAAMSPTLGRYQVIVVEDADRVTERGADALLKSVEEPALVRCGFSARRPPTMSWRQSGRVAGCSTSRHRARKRLRRCCSTGTG